MVRIFENSTLSSRNSFHVDVNVARIVEFDSPTELGEVFSQKVDGAWMVLGGGNNILFTQDVAATLIVPCGKKITVLSDNGQEIFVDVEAGVEWDDFVEWCVARELWGVENLSLIPGKVGAAPVQNIGAYGAEASNVIERVTMFDVASRTMVSLAAEHCAFGYRESVFKHALRGRVIITSVVFRLSRTPMPHLGYGDVEREVEVRGGVSLRNIRDAICSIRRAKLPDTAVLGNAGSFFKNPIVDNSKAESLREQYPDMPTYAVGEGKTKLAAGWLIDKAGLKGYREGAVGVHERQALVLVNFGGATGGQVIAFARKVQQKVKEKFGIDIDTEVNIL